MLKQIPHSLLLVLCVGGTPAFANTIYSGLRNISLHGAPDTIVDFDLDLADDPGSWDTIRLDIATIGMGGGANTVFDGAEVALASSSGSFPVITRLNNGDPFPSDPMFGSGSLILWGFGHGAADGDFFAAMEFGTFGGSPMYFGWIHLSVSNSFTSSPIITVIDWAYSDQPGQTITMGQSTPTPVPEPSTMLLFGTGLAAAGFGQYRRNND